MKWNTKMYKDQPRVWEYPAKKKRNVVRSAYLKIKCSDCDETFKIYSDGIEDEKSVKKQGFKNYGAVEIAGVQMDFKFLEKIIKWAKSRKAAHLTK